MLIKRLKAAQDAFDSWSKISKEERADYLLEISRRILEKKNILRLLSRYKTVNRTVKRLRLIFLKQQISINIFASVLTTDEGSVNQIDDNTMSLVVNEPVGVVGAVVAWNFPFLLSSWKLAPALAAGNTVVIQPSSSTRYHS